MLSLALTPPPDAAETDGLTETPKATERFSLPHRFGDYELLEEIDRGGMGVVYRARQLSLNRIVAVKMLLSGRFASEAFVGRLRAEAAAAARLHHPNIVAVHDFGECEGLPFFSMDYVEGRNLADVMREGLLGTRQVVRYLETISRAVHYAHEHSILHRDLKPSNILIDGAGEPRITDFGLAKRLTDSEPGTRSFELTLSGQALGSPNYMPPEQAAGKRDQVGPRSDVYSLGAILYHLLTGRAPFVGDSVTAVLKQVQEVEPVAPHILNPAIPRDLETICLKCLEKEPARRFATAQELSEELGRFLRDEPIRSRPVSRPEKIWRWSKRNPVVAGLSAATALLVMAGLVGVTWQWRRAEAHLYVADMGVAHQAWEDGNFSRTRELVATHRRQFPDLRGFEWRYLWKLARGDYEYTLGGDAPWHHRVAFSPDGGQLASHSYSVLEVWNLKTHQRQLMASNVAWGYGSFFSPDGKSLVAAGKPGQVVQIDVQTGLTELMIENAGTPIALLADGRTVATTDTNFLIALWDLPNRRERARIPGVGGENARNPNKPKVCITQDGRRAAELEIDTGPGYHDKGITIWDLDSRQPLVKLPAKIRVISMQFSPDGHRLAVGQADGTLKVWDLARTNEPPAVPAHSAHVLGVGFSPDGRTVATCSADQTVKLWSAFDIAAPRHVATLRGHESAIHYLCFSPDGQRLASGGRDPVHIWKLDRTPASAVAPGVFDNSDEARSLHFSPDSKTLVGNSMSGAKLWDTGRMQLKALWPGERVWTVTSDGQGIYTTGTNASGDRLVWLRSFSTGAVVREWPGTGILRGNKAAASPDGKVIATATWNGELQFWDTLHWRELALRTDQQRIHALVFTRDGATLITSGMRGITMVRDMRTMQSVAVLKATTLGLHSHALSPDGRTLAVGSQDQRIYLWDWRQGKLLATLEGHRQSVYGVDFSPDGKALASASSDGTVKLWNLALRAEVASLRFRNSVANSGEPLDERILAMKLSPDGNVLAARTYQGTLKIWRAASWAEIHAAEKADAR